MVRYLRRLLNKQKSKQINHIVKYKFQRRFLLLRQKYVLCYLKFNFKNIYLGSNYRPKCTFYNLNSRLKACWLVNKRIRHTMPLSELMISEFI